MGTKMVLVIRKDLNMRKGKMISMGAHACLAVILNLIRKGSDGVNPYSFKSLHLDKGEYPALDEWVAGSFKKICVYVNSAEELEAVYNKAKEKGLLCSLIKDAGLTEFRGVPTLTAAAIGPDESSRIDEITGGLPLL
jgi:PTH2 family peptidyl-tRNA hydrolase